ncbi:hypothetical protein [Actinomadura sp. 9N215]|uniref:hypothetical protein n=1 Tax=Actinomadura sp. 9N215 TaxID=3375150 RepID=UPI0037A2FA04
MEAVGEPGAGRHGRADARTRRDEFAVEVTRRPIWRLLLRGLGVYLPGWEMPAGALRVRDGTADGFGPPAYVNGDAGFGVQIPDRRRGLEPDREIYVRGRENPSFGIVVAGPAAAIGSRVVDADALIRFARRLTFEELFDTGDADSVPYAVRGARAVENAVFLDRAAGIGLCVEVDPVTRAVTCPLYARMGTPAERTVRAFGAPLPGPSPYGAPPHGPSPHGAPSHGEPSHGASPHGSSPQGAPTHGAPPYDPSPRGAPFHGRSP